MPETRRSFSRRPRTRSPNKQPVAVRMCQAIASRSSRVRSFQFTPTRVNRELKLMNRQLASEIARWKIKFRQCSDQLLQQKKERSQDWMEMGILRQHIEALRGNLQSPFAEVFSIHKQQLCTDFEMQMEVIAKQLVDSFHKKLDEMEESCVQKSEEFMAEIRTTATDYLPTPQETPDNKGDNMEIEQLLDLSSLTLSTSQSTQQEPPYPKPLNVPSSHPVSTPASQQRNSSRRRRLSIAMPWAVEILSEISDSESEADGWQHTVTHGEQVADNEGSYVARGIEEIQEENLSRCESTDNDGHNAVRSRTQRQTRTQVSYHEPKRSTKLRQGDPHTIPLPTGWCRSLPLPHFQKSKTKKKRQPLGESTNRM